MTAGFSHWMRRPLLERNPCAPPTPLAALDSHEVPFFAFQWPWCWCSSSAGPRFMRSASCSSSSRWTTTGLPAWAPLTTSSTLPRVRNSISCTHNWNSGRGPGWQFNVLCRTLCPLSSFIEVLINVLLQAPGADGQNYSCLSDQASYYSSSYFQEIICQNFYEQGQGIECKKCICPARIVNGSRETKSNQLITSTAEKYLINLLACHKRYQPFRGIRLPASLFCGL